MNQSNTTLRAGDVVRHGPSGEEWVLAYAEGDRVSPCGWPESIANAEDCTLVEAASDVEHVQMLEDWAGMNSGDHRTSMCKYQLQKLKEGA